MIRRWSGAVLAVLALACERRAPGQPVGEDNPSRSATKTPEAGRPTIVVLGTSLTAGFGLDPDRAYPALLQHKIDSAGLDFRVANAGVSGATSAGTRRQAEWMLRRSPPAVLVIETGANDGLRGLDVDSLRANIQAIIDRARAAHPSPKLLLIGMEVPPNLGFAYARRFHDVYRQVTSANDVPLVPFLLEGVAGIDSLNQADGMHPTAAGQRRIAATVWKVLEPLLRATTPAHSPPAGGAGLRLPPPT
jgi:acyl-CoA thioesterase-1